MLRPENQEQKDADLITKVILLKRKSDNMDPQMPGFASTSRQFEFTLILSIGGIILVSVLMIGAIFAVNNLLPSGRDSDVRQRQINECQTANGIVIEDLASHRLSCLYIQGLP